MRFMTELVERDDHPATPHIISYLTGKFPRLDPGEDIEVINTCMGTHEVRLHTDISGTRVRVCLLLLNLPCDPNGIRCALWEQQVVDINALRSYVSERMVQSAQ